MTTTRQEGFVPRKLTAELILRVKEYLLAGNDLETAAALVGVGYDTMQAWCKDGQRRSDAEPDVSMEEWMERGIYTPPLNAVVIRSYAGAESRAIGAMLQVVENDWRAAAEYLKLSRKDKYGQT